MSSLKLSRLLMCVSLGLVIAGPARGQTNLLNDGSFEQQQIAANSESKDPSGTGWTFSGEAGLVNGLVSGSTAYTSLTAKDGNQFAYLQTDRSVSTTDNDGQITQTVIFRHRGTTR